MKKSPILLKYGAIDAAFHFLKITLFATVLILLDRVSVSLSDRPFSISSHRAPDRQTDRRTDRQTDRQTRMRYSCVYRRHTLHSEAIFEVKEVALSREVVSREGERERETRKRLRDCSKQSRDVLSFLDYAVCFMIVFEVAAFSIETPTLQTERDLCLRDTRPDDRCLGKTSNTL